MDEWRRKVDAEQYARFLRAGGVLSSREWDRTPDFRREAMEEAGEVVAAERAALVARGLFDLLTARPEPETPDVDAAMTEAGLAAIRAVRA